jgi:pSer/pThr/pTyr-binding forkhead associated (FHA) protein
VAELVLYLKERELSRHLIARSTFRIGRDPESDVVIDNVGVSRHHATVLFDGARFLVRDEGSQNGVFVNGQRVAVHTLEHGQTIQLGKFALLFHGRPEDPDFAPERSSAVAPSRQRDPQATMALAPDEVKSMLQNVQAMAELRAAEGANASPETETERQGRAWLLPALVISVLLMCVLVYLLVS